MKRSRNLGKVARSTALAVVALLVLPTSAATAKTVTVGQLFTPTFPCAADYTSLVTGVANGRSYVIPKTGVVTSWSFKDGATAVKGLRLKIGRKVAGGKYKIVGGARATKQTTSVVNTYKASIHVHAGDLIGIYENGGDCLTVTNKTHDTYVYASGDLATGMKALFSPTDDDRFPVLVRVRVAH